MGPYLMSEKAAALSYGFLASKVSSIIDSYLQKEKPLSNEDKRIITEAQKFIEDIITGQRLVSGDMEGLSPSSRSIEAVRYALKTLRSLQALGELDTLQDSNAVKSFFEQFNEMLIKFIDNPDQLKDKKQELKLISLFFLWISKNLIGEAQDMIEKSTKRLTLSRSFA